MTEQNTILSDADLDTLDTLARGATPGPWAWEWEPEPGGRPLDALVTLDPTVPGGAILWAKDDNMYQVPLQITEADRRYLEAVSPDVTLKLLAMLKAARSALAEREAGPGQLAPLSKATTFPSLGAGHSSGTSLPTSRTINSALDRDRADRPA